SRARWTARRPCLPATRHRRQPGPRTASTRARARIAISRSPCSPTTSGGPSRASLASPTIVLRRRTRASRTPRRSIRSSPHGRGPRGAPRHERRHDRRAACRRRRRLTFETRAPRRYRDERGMMLGRGSFSWLQSGVSVLAGLVSISGAVYSAVRYVKPVPGTLDVLAVVRSETGDRPLSGSTVRIATRDDVPVAELTAPADGHVRQPLHEGDYRLRVSAPRF